MSDESKKEATSAGAPARKRKFRLAMPDTYIIVAVIVGVMAVLTWVIPPGTYDYHEVDVNGRMKSIALRFTTWSVLRPASLLPWNTSRAARAFLKMLSLKAPSPCVMKNGMKRRWENSSNCEPPDISGEGGQHAGNGGRHHGGEGSAQYSPQPQPRQV